MSGRLDGAAAQVVEQVKAAQLPPPLIRQQIRTGAGLTFRELGEVLGVTGMTAWRWETGRTTPPRDAAIRYRQLLDALVEAVA